MISRLFLIFNHRLTEVQEKDAYLALQVDRIIGLPEDLKSVWNQIPPDLPEIGDYLSPVKAWLSDHAEPEDFVLIQGDFGACYLMARFAFELGLIPVYSTTVREAVEEHGEDGSVELTHKFMHRAFRSYGG